MRKTILLSLLACSVALGQEQSGMEKYRDYTPQQIAEMPEELRSSEVPMTYIFAAQNGMSLGSETLFAMQLNTLMYSGVHDYPSAVKQFQRDLGDGPTGILTVFQIAELEKRAEKQKLARVNFPKQFSSYITEERASVEGTFVILDDKIAYPVNHAEVECYRDAGYCKVMQMYLDVPDDDSWAQSYHIFKFDPETYYISNWTKDTIDAEPRQDPSACRTTTMNLNFATKEFYQITRNSGRKCEVMGEVIPPLERPRISQIVNGEPVHAEVFAAIEKAAFDALSSDFRRKVEELIAESEKANKD